MGGSDSERKVVYAVRIEARVERDLQEALLRSTDLSKEETARVWVVDLYQAFASLGTSPQRCSVAVETCCFGREVRQMQYRRDRTAPAYRILFTILKNSDEGPTVSVLHVRPASWSPMIVASE